MHHGAQGGSMSVRSGSRPRHFSFLVVHKENTKNKHFLSVFGGGREHTMDNGLELKGLNF